MSRLASAHKLSIVTASSVSNANPGVSSNWEDMQIVHAEGPAVRVRQTVVETANGVRYTAELSAEIGERAIIDAPTAEDLRRMIAPAARAFSLSVALRQKRFAAA